MISWFVAVLLASAPMDAFSNDAPLTTAHRGVVARDGAKLWLERTALTHAAPTSRAIVLFADLGFGRGVFAKLAPWLAARGHRVYVVELRGQGGAEARGDLAGVFSDIHDLLAAVRADGITELDVLAHGWVGALVLAALADEPNIRRVVAINTPVRAEVPSVAAERFLIGGGAFTSLASSPAGFATFEQLFALATNAPTSERVAMLKLARDLGPERSAQLLSWMRTGDLPLGDRSVVARLRAFNRPTLQLLALADGFSPPEQCSPLRELSKAPVTLKTYTRFFNKEDYGHVTVLLSDDAVHEVFPAIAKFWEAP